MTPLVQGAAATRPAGHALRATSAVALSLVLASAIAFFVAFSSLAGDPASTCSWCESNAFDEAVRRVLYANASIAVGRWSHLFSMVLAPVIGIVAAVVPGYRSSKPSDGTRNLAVMINTVVLTIAISDGVKKLFDRERPGFHHGRGDLIEAARTVLERNVSFFSGDTAIAFCAVAAGFALCRLRGYRLPRWLLIVGVADVLLAGVLRIVADMHWATDVMVGAAVGSLVGAGLPMVLHGRVDQIFIAPRPDAPRLES